MGWSEGTRQLIHRIEFFYPGAFSCSLGYGPLCICVDARCAKRNDGNSRTGESLAGTLQEGHGTTAIRAQGLTKRYGATLALDPP